MAPYWMFMGYSAAHVIGGLVVHTWALSGLTYADEWRGYLFSGELGWTAPLVVGLVARITDD